MSLLCTGLTKAHIMHLIIRDCRYTVFYQNRSFIIRLDMSCIESMTKLSMIGDLQILDVSCNQFGDDCFRRLLAILRNCYSLTTLIASNNNITANCFLHIAGLLGMFNINANHIKYKSV